MVDAIKNISTCLLFLYVYFTFYFAGIYTFHVVAFHSFMLAYIIYYYKLLLKLYSLNRHKVVIKIFLYILYLCILIGILSIFFNGTYNDLSNLKFYYTFFKIPRLVLCTVFLVVFLQVHFSHENLFNKFSTCFIIACCLYVCTTILMLLFPEIKSFWFNVIEQTADATHASEQTFTAVMLITRSGLRGFSGLDCGLYCSMAFMLLIYQVIERKRIRATDIIMFLLLLTGNIFYSRSSLFVVIISLGVLFFYLLKNNTKSLLKVLGCSLGIAAILIIYGLNNMDNEWVQWAFGPLYGIISFLTGESQSFSMGSSSDELGEMYDVVVFQNSFFMTLFGEGIYKNTDVGYIRQFFFYGAIGMLIYYGGYIYTVILQLEKKSKNNYYNYLLMNFLLASLFLEFKGETLHYFLAIFSAIYLLHGIPSNEYRVIKRNK